MMGKIYDEAIGFSAIYRAVHECSKGVKWKESVLNNYLHPCRAARVIIESFKKGEPYKPLPYHRFMVKEPKVREIYSTRFRDRVIQRAMLNSGLYRLLTKRLIYDNFACQKGKGTDMAIRRLKKHLIDYYEKNSDRGCICQIDVRKFFPSIPHIVAKEALKRCIKIDEEALQFCYDIIDYFEDQSEKYGYDSSFGRRGIAPGSEFSQLVALNVLDPIDHFVKDELGIKHYIRYMDDIIFFHEDQQTAKEIYAKIKKRIELLGLEVNKKSRVRPFKHGLTFLKFKFKFNNNGKLIVKIDDKNMTKERRKLKSYKSMFDRKIVRLDLVYSNLMSWSDHLKYANAGMIRKSIHDFANKLFGIKFFLGKSKIQSKLRRTAMMKCFG